MLNFDSKALIDMSDVLEKNIFDRLKKKVTLETFVSTSNDLFLDSDQMGNENTVAANHTTLCSQENKKVKFKCLNMAAR